MRNMIYLNKLLPLFILPLSIIFVFIVIGLIKNKKILIYTGLVILYILSINIFSSNFFKFIEGSEKRVLINEIEKVDAIVVLSGMLNINEDEDSTFIDWGDPDRYFAGINLFKKGKSEKIIFTGAKLPWEINKINEGQILKKFAIKDGIDSNSIIVTKIVENTADEAEAVSKIIKKNSKIILVTSAFHMKRSKYLFEKKGIIVFPYKVDYKISRNKKITILDFIPSANNLQIVELGFREIIGNLYYRLKYL